MFQVTGVSEDGLNSLNVYHGATTLIFRTHNDFKAEGYDFRLKKQIDDTWEVATDRTSHKCPGSLILWLFAKGYEGWHEVDQAAADPEILKTVPVVPADVHLTQEEVEVGLGRFILHELKLLGITEYDWLSSFVSHKGYVKGSGKGFVS